MKVPPPWKIRREIDRAGGQIRRAAADLYEPILRRRHDRRLARGRDVRAGDMPLGDKIAVFVIFQPRGLAESVLFTCRHLARNGYATLLVSNTALAESDAARLVPSVWRLFQRPNFGYDFGGYRDAIRLLADEGVRPRRLLLINDSIWMPLRDDDTTLATLEGAGTALAGLVWMTRDFGRHGRDHLQSHCLSLGEEALEHPAFARFWRDYPLSDNRDNTIERGEKGLSSALLDAGLSHFALVSAAGFVASLAAAPPDFVRDALAHARYIPASRSDGYAGPLDNERRTLVASFENTADWRASAVRHVRDVVTRYEHYPYTIFAWAAHRRGGLAFLKKRREPHYDAAREITLDLAERGAIGPIAPEVLSELKSRR